MLSPVDPVRPGGSARQVNDLAARKGRMVMYSLVGKCCAVRADKERPALLRSTGAAELTLLTVTVESPKLAVLMATLEIWTGQPRSWSRRIILALSPRDQSAASPARRRTATSEWVRELLAVGPEGTRGPHHQQATQAGRTPRQVGHCRRIAVVALLPGQGDLDGAPDRCDGRRARQPRFRASPTRSCR